MAKQIFNVIIFTNNLNVGMKGYITYHKVSFINKFILYANTKYPDWKFLTVYDNATKEKLEMIKR